MIKNKSKTNHHGFKTFLSALGHVLSRPVEAKKYLTDKRLTNHEKRLLTFFLKVRENDFSLIPEFKDDISFEASPFLNGFRYYLLSIASLFKGESKKSEEFMMKAIPMMGESYNDEFFRRMNFRVTINQFFIHVNLKKIQAMDKQYLKVKALSYNTDEEYISLKFVDVCYHLMKGHYSQAEEYLEELGTLKDKMNDHQLGGYQVELFDFYIKVDNYTQAYKALEEMKKFRSFRLSANFKYMDKLLRFLHKNERIYIYDKDFIEHSDIYYMANVIKCLDSAEMDEAKHFWDHLSSNSPETFGPNFSYHGDKCLFSLCLTKCLAPKNKIRHVPSSGIRYSGQELALIEAIQNSPGAQIKKEDLFLIVFGREWESKEDLVKLTLTTFRINKKGQYSIKSKKGSYFIGSIQQIAG